MATLATVRPPSRYHAGAQPMDVVTPEDLYEARRQARGGLPFKLWACLSFFRNLDDEIPSAMQSLLAALTEDSFTLVPADESDEAARQTEVTSRMLLDLDVVSLLEDLLEGHYYGLRAESVMWDGWGYDNTAYYAPVGFGQVPMHWLYAKRAGGRYNVLHVGDRPRDAYPDGALLVYVAGKLPTFQHLNFEDYGRGLAACRFGIYDWFAMDDWAAYAEAFGMPMVLGTLMQGWNKDDKELLTQAVKGLASDSRAVVTEKGKVDLLDSPFRASSSGTFDKLVEVAKRARGRIIKSETLTDNDGKHGTYGALTTANGIRVDVALLIARKLKKLVQGALVKPFTERAFGRTLTQASIRVQAVEDLLRELRIDQGLLNMGVELSRAELRERYGRNAPETEEDTMRRQAGTTNPLLNL